MLSINKDNVEQYIRLPKFSEHPEFYERQQYLTKGSFVTLWQTSVDMEEFIARCTLINKLLLEKYGTITEYYIINGQRTTEEVATWQIPAKLAESTYNTRASRYRKKGVNLKKLQRRTPKERDTSEWDRLAKLAEQLA